MVNISKKKVESIVRKDMEAQLADLLVLRLRKKEVMDVLNEVLTPAERLTVLKRVAAVGMLAHGYDGNDVADTLALSTNTVSKFNTQLKQRKFPILWKLYHKIDATFFDFLSYDRKRRGRYFASVNQTQPVKPRKTSSKNSSKDCS